MRGWSEADASAFFGCLGVVFSFAKEMVLEGVEETLMRLSC